MIFFPKNVSLQKDTSLFPEGVKAIKNGVVVGERAAIFDKSKRVIYFTKGANYQIESTIPRIAFSGILKKNNALCFPGFNHRNWYHVVADMGFQIFQAKQDKLIDSVILPEIVKSSPTFIEFFSLFGLKLYFVNHCRFVQNVSSVFHFDKRNGRLSEAIKSECLDQRIEMYLSFLEKKFLENKAQEQEEIYGKKIFSTRRGSDSRVFDGVDSIEAEYIEKGYQIVHFAGKTLFEQMTVMENVTHFAGFHGANLTNVIFAHKCQFVEELITQELSGDFATFAKFKGMQHSRRKLV